MGLSLIMKSSFTIYTQKEGPFLGPMVASLLGTIVTQDSVLDDDDDDDDYDDDVDDDVTDDNDFSLETLRYRQHMHLL